MELKVDHIIVGGGLGGMLLAWELYSRKESFVVICDEAPASSSVAAGTWNPVSFRTMSPTWRAQEMIDRMLEIYPQIDEALGTKYFNLMKVEKILANEQESEFWKSQAITDKSKDFLVADLEFRNIKGESKAIGEVKQTGRLDLPSFITDLKTFFEQKGQLKRESFDYSSLEVAEDAVTYNEIEAKHVLFAEGTYINNNPWFNWLPFRPVKGDVLTIRSADLKVDSILKKNIFILPLGDDLYKVGATYHWDDASWEPSERAREEILGKFELITDCTYEVLDQKAGIRPASYDRRAFVGTHPDNKNLHVFNGLGSKGVFLGPLLAQEFIDSLSEPVEIHPEVSINRCLKKFYKKD